jgi:O-methyltransferase
MPKQRADELYFAGVIPYMTSSQKEIIERCLPYTQTGREALFSLIRAFEYLTKNNILGAFVECGVWKGGSVMAMALALDRLGQESSDIYLFDTFRGMPASNNFDVDLEGNRERWYREESDQYIHAGKGERWNAVSLNEVQRNIQSISSRQRFHYQDGLVEDTIPATAPQQIALLRLDTDFYASTRHELDHLYPRLSKGGVLIVDDYGHFLGARKAVDEYIAENNVLTPFHRINYTAIIGTKP